MGNVIAEASEKIKARLQELADEQKKLERALTSLDGSTTTRRRSPRGGRGKATTKSKAGRRSSAKRAPKGQRREQFLAAVKEKPGQTASELARAIGISANQAHSLGRKAHTDKLVTKRARKYYPRG